MPSPIYHNVSVRLSDEDKQRLDKIVELKASQQITGKASMTDVLRYCILTVYENEVLKK